MNWAILNFGVFVALCVGAVVGVRRAPAYLDRRRARKALSAAATLDESTVEGQLAQVTGVVRVMDRSITAPLSARTCAVARSRIRVSNSAFGDVSAPYETMAFVPFEVVQANGRAVIIDGNYAQLDLVPLRGSSFEKARRSALLAEHHIEEGTRVWCRFEEVVVAFGDRVSVSGLVMKDRATAPTADERGFRDAVAPSIRLVGNLANPIVIGNPVD
jgi:hypothetical protein